MEQEYHKCLSCNATFLMPVFYKTKDCDNYTLQCPRCGHFQRQEIITEIQPTKEDITEENITEKDIEKNTM